LSNKQIIIATSYQILRTEPPSTTQ